MTGARVLVTGVGGQPGFDLARRLHQLGAKVIGIDAEPLANGLLLNGIEPRLCPHVTDPRYGEALVKLCDTESVDAVAPTVESELPALIDLAGDLAAVGTRTWLPTHRAAAACRDKAVFARALAEAGVAHPATWLPEQLDDAPAAGGVRRQTPHGSGFAWSPGMSGPGTGARGVPADRGPDRANPTHRNRIHCGLSRR